MNALLQAPNINVAWAALIMEQLCRLGVDFFCVSPGSRSAPLIAALAGRRDGARVVHFDERGAAFHALGHARATGRPAVCITTSGTAVANAYPAILEARQSRTPLLLLTADRPPELRDVGANQTIDQVKLFGDNVNWFFDMPCPTTEIPPAMVLSTIAQAWYRAVRAPAGPVHVNCMFRDPLAPQPHGHDVAGYLESVKPWLAGSEAFGAHAIPELKPSADAMTLVSSQLATARKGLIVAGSLRSEQEQRAVQELAGRLRWPVLPDVTSGLRLTSPGDCVVPYADLILCSRQFAERNRPDVVLQIGGAVVSRRIQEFLVAAPPVRILRVKDTPGRLDPFHQVALHIESSLEGFCNAVPADSFRAPAQDGLDAWRRASQAVHLELENTLAADTRLSEPAVARLVSAQLPPGSGLVLASSMPVRDMDTFGALQPGSSRVIANRGASGIDGTVATAAGVARGLARPMTAVIGDLALLHDLNSLALFRDLTTPSVIVALNNNGGGIFHFLPVAEHPEMFETYFGTPHHMTFEHAAAQFGLAYSRPGDTADLARTLREAWQRSGPSLIEVITDRAANVALHRAWQQSAGRAVDECA